MQYNPYPDWPCIRTGRPFHGHRIKGGSCQHAVDVDQTIGGSQILRESFQVCCTVGASGPMSDHVVERVSGGRHGQCFPCCTWCGKEREQPILSLYVLMWKENNVEAAWDIQLGFLGFVAIAEAFLQPKDRETGRTRRKQRA